MMVMIKQVHLLHPLLVVSVLLCIKTRSFGSESVHGDSRTAIRCIETERKALLDLKQGFSLKYDSLSSWGSQADKKECCKWEGVHCNNRTGYVTLLDLSTLLNSAMGNISPSLLVLQNLNHLDLGKNNFGGIPIPNFIGSLSKLVYLNLATSNFSGAIPNQLGDLSRLEHLDLSGNNFSPNPIPESVGSLSKLVFLDLSWANFSGDIPNQLGNLSRLEHLNLGGNDLSNITIGTASKINPSLLVLQNLNYLDLEGNNFGGIPIPRFIGSLSKLVYLNLAASNFSGAIPRQLGNLSRLEHLYLGGNDFSHIKDGNLDWLSQLSSLTYLNMGSVDFSQANHWVEKVIMSLPSLIELSLTDCQLPSVMSPTFSLINSSKSIHTLNLEYNNLTSSIYNWLFNFSGSLVDLQLSGNMLNDQIPETFGHMTFLEYLSLSSSELEGVIPISLGNMTSLAVLYLDGNHLQGVISREHLSNLFNLRTLILSYNNISFNLSSQWVSPFQLIELDLRSCNLGPQIPNWIQTQRGLEFLDLSNNKIAESMPMWFWGLSPFFLLNLSSNKITGTLPTLNLRIVAVDLSSNYLEGSIPVLSNMTSLNLSKNKFSGELAFLRVKTGMALEHLDVSHNLLSGRIPDCWMHFKNLKILNFAYNNLSGGIPSSFGFLHQLEVLVLHRNILSGELPVSLQSCYQLSFLDLGANNFSGNIPDWIGGNLSKLYVLILRSNDFSGSIPLQLCHLRNLQVLDLSVNNIFGKVPQCISNFTVINQKVENPYRHIAYHELSSAGGDPYYFNSALVDWKGGEYEFGKNLELMKSIDFSSNKLTGELPKTITGLIGLVAFNVSRNNIHGRIPVEIGNMTALQSLDLSRNEFSGEIPKSMSDLTFLSYLNLSNNNLSGRIPTGTQLQSFDSSSYIGNNALCGSPLVQKCPGEEPSQVPSIDDGKENSPEGVDEFDRWFFIGAAVGFSTTFWGIFGALLLNRRWRHAYFLYLDKLKDWIYVKVAASLAKFPWKF